MRHEDCAHCNGEDVPKKVHEAIEEFGWAATGVAPGEGYHPFVYTTGLTEMGKAEMIMIGLPIYTAHGILQDVIDAMHEGLELEPGKTYPNLIGGDYQLAVVEVLNPVNDDYPQSITHRYYEGCFQSYQLVWPDRHGKFPWDKGSKAVEEPVLGVWTGE